MARGGGQKFALLRLSLSHSRIEPIQEAVEHPSHFDDLGERGAKIPFGDHSHVTACDEVVLELRR